MCDITYKQKIYFNNNYLLYMVWVMADIDHLHISNFFFVNYTFYSSNFPLYDKQNGTCSSKNNGRDNKFDYNFLKICRYLNLEKKSVDNFITNRNFTTC